MIELAKRQKEEEQREGEEQRRVFVITLKKIESQKQENEIEEHTERNEVQKKEYELTHKRAVSQLKTMKSELNPRKSRKS